MQPRLGTPFSPTAIDVKREQVCALPGSPQAEFRRVWARSAICLYARFILESSITVMATVCRFFPSQSIGDTSASAGNLRPTGFPVLLPERQTGPLAAYSAGTKYVHRTCSKPIFPSPSRQKAGKVMGFSLYIHKTLRVAARPRPVQLYLEVVIGQVEG